jgi:hypothetical protein
MPSQNYLFTALWLYAVFLTGGYWIYVKRREHQQKEAHQNLSLESIQNRLFDSFVNLKAFRLKREKEISLPQVEEEFQLYITFSKDELIEYFTGINIYTLEYEPHLRNRKKNPLNLIHFLFNHNHFIELELAQTLADIIIERAKKKNVLHLEQDESLSDTYRYKQKK